MGLGSNGMLILGGRAIHETGINGLLILGDRANNGLLLLVGNGWSGESRGPATSVLIVRTRGECPRSGIVRVR